MLIVSKFQRLLPGFVYVVFVVANKVFYMIRVILVFKYREVSVRRGRREGVEPHYLRDEVRLHRFYYRKGEGTQMSDIDMIVGPFTSSYRKE